MARATAGGESAPSNEDDESIISNGGDEGVLSNEDFFVILNGGPGSVLSNEIVIKLCKTSGVEKAAEWLQNVHENVSVSSFKASLWHLLKRHATLMKSKRQQRSQEECSNFLKSAYIIPGDTCKTAVTDDHSYSASLEQELQEQKSTIERLKSVQSMARAAGGSQFVLSNDEDERVLSDDEDERVVSNNEDERVISNDEDERVLSNDEDERVLSDDEDERVVSDNEDERVLSNAEDERVLSNAEDERVLSNAEDERVLSNAEDERVLSNAEDEGISDGNESIISNDIVLQKCSKSGVNAAAEWLHSLHENISVCSLRRSLRCLLKKRCSLMKNKGRQAGRERWINFLKSAYVVPNPCKNKTAVDNIHPRRASLQREMTRLSTPRQPTHSLAVTFLEEEIKSKDKQLQEQKCTIERLQWELNTALLMQKALRDRCDKKATKMKQLQASNKYYRNKSSKLEKKASKCQEELEQTIEEVAEHPVKKKMKADKDNQEKMRKEIVELHHVIDVLKEEAASNEIDCYDTENYKFTPRLQKCVYKLLDNNVSCSRVAPVIEAVLEMAEVYANRLPSTTYVTRMKKKRQMAQKQVVKEASGESKSDSESESEKRVAKEASGESKSDSESESELEKQVAKETSVENKSDSESEKEAAKEASDENKSGSNLDAIYMTLETLDTSYMYMESEDYVCAE